MCLCLRIFRKHDESPFKINYRMHKIEGDGREGVICTETDNELLLQESYCGQDVECRWKGKCIMHNTFFRLGTAGRSFRVDGRVCVICTESYNELLF